MIKLKPINIKPVFDTIGKGIITELSQKMTKQVQFGGDKYADLAESTKRTRKIKSYKRLILKRQFFKDAFSYVVFGKEDNPNLEIFINNRSHYSGEKNRDLAIYHLEGRSDMPSTIMFPQNEKHVDEIQRWKIAKDRNEIGKYYSIELKKQLAKVIKKTILI